MTYGQTDTTQIKYRCLLDHTRTCYYFNFPTFRFGSENIHIFNMSSWGGQRIKKSLFLRKSVTDGRTDGDTERRTQADFNIDRRAMSRNACIACSIPSLQLIEELYLRIED